MSGRTRKFFFNNIFCLITMYYVNLGLPIKIIHRDINQCYKQYIV